MIQSGRFLTEIVNNTSGLDKLVIFPVKLMSSYSNEISNTNNKKI